MLLETNYLEGTGPAGGIYFGDRDKQIVKKIAKITSKLVIIPIEIF